MTYISGSQFAKRSLRFALAVAALASATHLVAQSPKLVKVKVPFSFQNGSQHLPAGTYLIDMRADQMLSLRNLTDNKKVGFAMTHPEEKLTAPKKSTVVFHRANGQYFLREVWIAGNPTGRRCPKSRAEKQIEVGGLRVETLNTEVALNVLP